VQHIKCNTTLIQADDHLPTSWAILCHSGTHNHVWPKAKKPNKLAQEALKKEVANNPLLGQSLGSQVHQRIPSTASLISILLWQTPIDYAIITA
jgi:hypothetical protein